jgi:hypothetical protein
MADRLIDLADRAVELRDGGSWRARAGVRRRGPPPTIAVGRFAGDGGPQFQSPSGDGRDDRTMAPAAAARAGVPHTPAMRTVTGRRISEIDVG